MKYKNKGISIVLGIFFIVVLVIFLESKKDSLFSEKIIAEISDQVGKDLERFFVPLQKNLDEILKWADNVDLSVENESSLIRKWIEFFVSHPKVSSVVCRESDGREFIIYKDKDSYVISLRKASDRNDSVYIWKRFRNPEQEISRWNEIVKINSSDVSVEKAENVQGASSVSWNGEAESQFTGRPVLQGIFTYDNNKSITIEIPVSEIVNVLTRFRWYGDRRIFIETMNGDYIQIPALKNDSLVFISRNNLSKLAENDSVYYFIIQSLKIGETGNFETHTFDFNGDRWWIQTTHRYPVSYGIAIKEDQLLVGKIKQNLYYILGIILVVFVFILFLVRRKHKKMNLEEPLNTEFDKKDNEWLSFIQNGENANLEFKSSLRWDLNENKVNQKLEEVVLKTVTAFSNGEGGNLIIGIDDNGEVLGLENDFNSLKKHGPDYLELHLRNLFNSQFGISFTTNNIRIEFPEVIGKQICVIHVKKGKEPLYLELADKSGKKSEKFFVRSGNTSQEILSLSELNTYISSRFNASSS